MIGKYAPVFISFNTFVFGKPIYRAIIADDTFFEMESGSSTTAHYRQLT